MSDSVRSHIRRVEQDALPEASQILELAKLEYAAGNLLDVEAALPVYIREGSWKKRSEQ